MGGVMWIIFILMLALLALSLFWLIWRLRGFSQSQNQTVLDDRLMQAMLGDTALPQDVKKKLVRSAAGAAGQEEQPLPEEAAPALTEEADQEPPAQDGAESGVSGCEKETQAV